MPHQTKPRKLAGECLPGATLEKDTWVQCERCEKWRRLCVGLSRRAAASRKHWFCELNPDPLHDDCQLPQEATGPERSRSVR